MVEPSWLRQKIKNKSRKEMKLEAEMNENKKKKIVRKFNSTMYVVRISARG